MIPHYLENGGKKVFWPGAIANILYQQFRTEIITELRKRDRAHGIPESGQVYEEIKGDKKNPDEITGYKIDPILSSLAHSGADTNNRLKKKWYDYCIEPHEIPEGLSVPIPKPTYKHSTQSDDPGVLESKEAGIAESVASNPVSVQPPGELRPVSVPDMIADGERKRNKKPKKNWKG